MDPRIQKVLRPVKYFVLDNLEILTGKRDRLTPPERLSLIVGGNFKSVGEEFLDYFVRFCGLQPWHRVLDVGSGVGRMAVPLTKFIDKRGGYDGLDILKVGVDWCKRTIARRYKNFHFHHADMLNSMYNPAGKVLPRDYAFPFAGESYDFVFLTSVFTHMLQEDLTHYLGEIRRVMKPGAVGLITFFLINDESLSLISSGRSEQKFAKHGENTYIVDEQVPEGAVGYDERWIRRTLADAALPIAEPVHYGGWCGREPHLSYQDIVIITKL
jgi:SAM-dependent methyltransferase